MVVWQRWRQFDTLQKPWYAYPLVGLLALGDLVGLTGILEGLRGRELVTDAPLPAEAAGRRFGQGMGTALLAALSARATGAFFRRGAGPEPAPLASEAPPPGGGLGWLARLRALGQRAWQQLTGRGGPVTIPHDRAGHIFSKQGRPGHLPDTPENRQLLINTASDRANFLGTDKFGNDWYAKITPDGKQVWVQVRGNNIINGGLNEVPRSWHPETGPSSPTKPR